MPKASPKPQACNALPKAPSPRRPRAQSLRRSQGWSALSSAASPGFETPMSTAPPRLVVACKELSVMATCGVIPGCQPLWERRIKHSLSALRDPYRTPAPLDSPTGRPYNRRPRLLRTHPMAEDRVQRRLTTILAADVVGYSRLMEQDEAGTMALLRARRHEVLMPAVARQGGRVFKVMGDGVLIEFTSVVNAVECAIDLQKAMQAQNTGLPVHQHILLRIGINLGDVIVEGSDLYGDGVNLAARLESLAEPGGICVSGDVYRQVRSKLQMQFQDMGEQKVKNIVGPVHAYRVQADGD